MAHVHPAAGMPLNTVVIKRVYSPPCIRGCGSGKTTYSFILNGVQVRALAAPARAHPLLGMSARTAAWGAPDPACRVRATCVCCVRSRGPLWCPERRARARACDLTSHLRTQHEAKGERSCMGSYKADFLTAGFSFNIDACSCCTPAVNIKVCVCGGGGVDNFGSTPTRNGVFVRPQDAADQLIGAFRDPTCMQMCSNACCKCARSRGVARGGADVRHRHVQAVRRRDPYALHTRGGRRPVLLADAPGACGARLRRRGPPRVA